MSNFFLLKSEKQRESVIAYLNRVNIGGKLLSVEIKPYKRNRSHAQNRLLWSWYNILSPETGYTPDELHEQFKVRLLGVEEKVVEGITLVQPRSSKKLSTEEFTDFLSRIELVALEMGINLPHPGDYEFIMGKDSLLATPSADSRPCPA